MTKNKFITVEFVCNKSNENELLEKIKSNLPIILTVLPRSEENLKEIKYGDPFLPENRDKIGYVIRISKKMYIHKNADIEERGVVFNRTDIREMINKLWSNPKYSVIQTGNSTDFSYAAKNIDEFVRDLREIFSSLKLEKESWEAFLYFALGDQNQHDKFRTTPVINAVPIARIENGEINYRIDCERKVTEADIKNQLSAFVSLTKEFGSIKHSRIKRAIGRYERVNKAMKLKKSSHTYNDPETNEEIVQDTTVEDRLEEVFGETNDSDNLRQRDHLRKLKQRLKKIGQ